MEPGKTYYLIIDGMIDYYFYNEGKLSHFVFDPDYIDALNATGAEEIKLVEVMEELVEGQVFETYRCLYVKKGGVCITVDKEALYEQSIDMIVKQLEWLQEKDYFIKMNSSAQNRLKTYIFDMLCSAEDMPERLRFPIFATYNYQQADVQHDLIPQNVSMSMSSETWKSAMRSIDLGMSIDRNTSMTYSYIAKKLIMK